MGHLEAGPRGSGGKEKVCTSKRNLLKLHFYAPLNRKVFSGRAEGGRGSGCVGGNGENGSLLGQHIQIELRGGKSPTKAQKIFNFNAFDTSSKGLDVTGGEVQGFGCDN